MPFKSIITFIIVFIAISSCGTKEEKTEQESYDEVITALNKSDYEKALILLSDKDKTQVETIYYTAQAYSIKARVDVYTLFPIMKMKLFDVALNEWSQVEKLSNRNQSHVTTTLLGNDLKTDVGTLTSELEKSRAIKIKDIKVEITGFKDRISEFTSNSYDQNTDQYIEKLGFSCYRRFDVKSNIVVDRNSDRVDVGVHSYSEISKEDCIDKLDRAEEGITSQDRFLRDIKYESINLLDRAIINIKKKKKMERAMKFGFALFESISIIKNTPDLNDNNSKDVYSALEKLDQVKVRNDVEKRYKSNSTKQMGLLSSFLILGALKNSIDLDEVKEPYDIACKVDAEALINHYSQLRTGLVYLLKSMEGTTFASKNAKNLNSAKEKMKEAPLKLTEEQKEDYQDDIEDFIKDNC